MYKLKKKDTIVLLPSLSFKPNKPMRICYLKQTQKPTRMSKITKAQIESFFGWRGVVSKNIILEEKGKSIIPNVFEQIKRNLRKKNFN